VEDILRFRKAAVIVAHPDDETIWAGGTMLLHSEVAWHVAVLSRGTDPDRAPRFFRALQQLGASGNIGNLDDDAQQSPLAQTEVEQVILSLLSGERFDLIITHGPHGEYTRHRRHEETSRTVSILWQEGRISSKEIWMFAYEDSGGKFLPRPIRTAHRLVRLPDRIWQLKYRLITETYGFGANSFEAKAAGPEEAFWCFHSATELSQCSANRKVRQ
jgi:LmbE family N-acetylglucosaminyl deacetylase